MAASCCRLAAAGVAVVEWLRVGDVWSSPAFVPFTLTGYGLLHSAFVVALLMAADQGSAGVGALFAAAAFAGMLMLLVQQVRSPATESTAEPCVAGAMSTC
ncbi:hypothetical protein [Fimbriiglobus ruber]|uniref:hypothetical protein n=1 Tax=Fimbriiglobus ruber TaxID=1908690 RepID=UPI000B4A7AC5|nr:hypothetical protein [Fimbriiglobus ruber]